LFGISLAHGLTGILNVLLQFPSLVLKGENTELIKKSIDYVEAVVLQYKGDFPSRGTHSLTQSFNHLTLIFFSFLYVTFNLSYSVFSHHLIVFVEW
jgi:hypothetical protein